jgi:hypothetical protein
MPCVINFLQLYLAHKAAVYQQQQTEHGAQQHSFTVGMESLSFGKLSGDWPCAVIAIYCRG